MPLSICGHERKERMITRRKALSAAAAAVAVITARSARAQGSYPDKLIKLYVPAPAGGQTDVLARPLAQKIQSAVGAKGSIDHRAGAGGALRSARLARLLFFVFWPCLDAPRNPTGLQECRLRSREELRADRERVGELHDPG